MIFCFAFGTPVKMAKFPLQVSFNMTITAHQIEVESEFPPRVRKMGIYYDYVNGRVRADIAGGYEAEKVYIRRYDAQREYMIRMPPLSDCKRSYLGEILPYPILSNSDYMHSNDRIDGVEVDYYLHKDFETRVHMYFKRGTDIPVRLIQESFTATDNGEDAGVSTPMLTYDYSDVHLGEPAAHYFKLMEPFTHEQCDRHVGGFPYIHVFHYFVKF
jgi:hypothetical protein